MERNQKERRLGAAFKLEPRAYAHCQGPEGVVWTRAPHKDTSGPASRKCGDQPHPVPQGPSFHKMRGKMFQVDSGSRITGSFLK